MGSESRGVAKKERHRSHQKKENRHQNSESENENRGVRRYYWSPCQSRSNINFKIIDYYRTFFFTVAVLSSHSLFFLAFQSRTVTFWVSFFFYSIQCVFSLIFGFILCFFFFFLRLNNVQSIQVHASFHEKWCFLALRITYLYIFFLSYFHFSITVPLL